MDRQQTINTQIKKVLQQYSLSLPERIPLYEMTSCLDQSREDQVVFYYLRNGQEHLEKFKRRLAKAKAKVIIINRTVKKREQTYFIDAGKSFLSVMRECVDTLYPIPLNKVYIGVTGTNGKSSVVSFLSQMANASAIKTLTIGTLGIILNGQKQPIFLRATTPSNVDLRRIIHDYQKDFDLCTLEVSSHGLDQNRIRGISFDVGVWTNFTQDHLDYHGSMESYYHAKLKLREYLKRGSAILIPSTAKNLCFRTKDNGSFCIVPIAPRQNAPDCCRLNFNLTNMLLAQRALERIFPDHSFDPSVLRPLKGRGEIIRAHGKIVVIDYAHTPDALVKITQAVRENLEKNPILLFGAGGNRDRSKRTLMGQMAQEYASYTYITTDNPRNEEAKDIIADIERGFSSPRYEVIVSRREAITKAVQNLSKNEVLIVAGKGDEDYIDIKGVHYPHSDQDLIMEALDNCLKVST